MFRKITFLALAVLVLAAAAATPALLSYQGRAENANGPMVGNYDVTFSLYIDATGGTAVWTEGPRALLFDEGVYQATLGKTQSLSGVSFNQPMFLEIEINGQLMDERVELTSVPYAMFANVAERAELAENADYATEAGRAVKADTAAFADTAAVAGHATEANHAATADNATNADNATEADHATTADYAESIPANISIDSAFFAKGMQTEGSVKLTSEAYKDQSVSIRQELPAGGGRALGMYLDEDGEAKIQSVGWGTRGGASYALNVTASGLRNLKAYDANIDTLIADSAYINGNLEVAENIRATSDERVDQDIRVTQNYTAGGGRSVAIGLDDDGSYISTSSWGTMSGNGYRLKISNSGLSNVRADEVHLDPGANSRYTQLPVCNASNEGSLRFVTSVPGVPAHIGALALCSGSGQSVISYSWQFFRLGDYSYSND